MENAVPTKDKLKKALDEGVSKADTDGDNKISEQEFVDFSSFFMENADEKYLHYWFQGLDVEKTGKLSFEQVESCFKMMYDNWDDLAQGKPTLEMLKVWFRSMDVNGDGEVNLEEMQNFLISLDKSMTTYIAATQLRRMDRDGNNNGTISFYEFAKHYGYDLKKNSDPYDGKGKSKCCNLI